MELEFEIDEQNFLDYQLFAASQSKEIRRKMLNSCVLLTLTFIVISLYAYFKSSIFLAVYFMVAAILCGLFYPKYFRWQYKKHYKKHIHEHYHNRFGETIYFAIKDGIIISKDRSGEGKINISEVEKVDETEKYFFVKLRTGVSLIIPKEKIASFDDVRNKFKSLGFSINRTVNNKWIK